MDSLAWGLPVLLLVLICPLMMLGMGLAAWIGVRFLGRPAVRDGHSSHACGPMVMGHGSHGDRSTTAEREVAALRARVEELERGLSEARAASSGGLDGRPE